MTLAGFLQGARRSGKTSDSKVLKGSSRIPRGLQENVQGNKAQDRQASGKYDNADCTDNAGAKTPRLLGRIQAGAPAKTFQVRKISTSGYVEILRVEACGDKLSTYTSWQSWNWACQVFGLPFAQISSQQRSSQYRLLSKAVHPDKNVEMAERASAAFQIVNAANSILKGHPPAGLAVLPPPTEPPSTPTRNADSETFELSRSLRNLDKFIGQDVRSISGKLSTRRAKSGLMNAVPVPVPPLNLKVSFVSEKAPAPWTPPSTPKVPLTPTSNIRFDAVQLPRP